MGLKSVLFYAVTTPILPLSYDDPPLQRQRFDDD